MRHIYLIAKREWLSFFTTPIGYIILGTLSLLTGLGFSLSLFAYARISQAPSDYGYPSIPDFEEMFLSPFLVFCGIMIMFLSPIITMRLFAEEKQRGTIELLLTYPLRDHEIILGKFLAAMGVVAVGLIPIGIDLLLVARYADIEPAVLALGLAAVLLMSATVISLGLFVSSLTRHAITSATLVFGIDLFLFIVGNIAEKMPEQNPVPAAWPAALQSVLGAVYGFVRSFATELALDAHATEMAQGILRPQDPVYYLITTAFFLYATALVLESRNWRGEA